MDAGQWARFIQQPGRMVPGVLFKSILQTGDNGSRPFRTGQSMAAGEFHISDAYTGKYGGFFMSEETDTRKMTS